MTPNDQPKWFADAISFQPQVLRIGNKNRQISIRQWSREVPSLRPVILVHGWLAHARWFDFIAPLLLSDSLGPIYAIDLPGMGDSDHLGSYEPEVYSEAIRNVITELNLKDSFLVAHSFGALVGTLFSASYSELISGLVIADSPFRLEPEQWSGQKPMRGRYYETLGQAMERFKLLPEQEVAEPCILSYIARHSLKQTDDGWRWKFDWNRAMNTKQVHDAWNAAFGNFENLKIPKAFIYAENSRYCDKSWMVAAKERLSDETPFICIKDAQHHLMLDQPHVFIETVSTLLNDGAWSNNQSIIRR